MYQALSTFSTPWSALTLDDNPWVETSLGLFLICCYSCKKDTLLSPNSHQPWITIPSEQRKEGHHWTIWFKNHIMYNFSILIQAFTREAYERCWKTSFQPSKSMVANHVPQCQGSSYIVHSSMSDFQLKGSNYNTIWIHSPHWFSNSVFLCFNTFGKEMTTPFCDHNLEIVGKMFLTVMSREVSQK